MDNPKKILAEESLLNILNGVAVLSPELEAFFKNQIVYQTLPKKTLLLRKGEIARHKYFIYEGSARSFYIDEDGREHTNWFSCDEDVMISVYSFFTQQPAAENIELLEDSHILSISWDSLQKIYMEYPEYNYHSRILTEKCYVMAEERAVLLRIKKPGDRYQLLLKTHPGLLQKASLGQIASFLGITGETLSRIRAKR